MAEQQLAPGEVLFSIGDEGDTVYVVIEGTLDVVTPTSAGTELIVGHLGPDDVVGEITAVIGGQRSATVRATTAVRVLALAGEAFDAWLVDNPERAERISIEARVRIDRTRVARVVAELVGPGNPDLVEEMTDAVDWVSIEAGHELFHQGDSADAAYILVGGQMRVTAKTDGELVLDTRIGRGDLIGEMGVIEQAPRNATATAIRDCTLARIPKNAFERLTAEHPSLMLPLVRKVIGRVSQRHRAKPHAGNVAIAVTAPSLDHTFVELLADEVARFGPTLHLSAARVEKFLNRRDIANAAVGSAADVRLTEFLHEVDVAHRWVLLECDGPTTDWSKRALRSADRVCVVTSAHPDAAEMRQIEQIRETVRATGDFDLWLAVVHPNSSAHPTGTRAVLERTGAKRSINVRTDDDRSIRRLARLLSGNGTGIAFSGGGARSYGQIGALRAMDEVGIVPDVISGTSMGSVIGAFAALVDDTERSLRQADKEFTGIKLLDYTLPLSSIFAAKIMTERMNNVFGGIDILDMMIPFVCLSTNLTKAELHEHRSGDAVHALRASVSLPGVFPPVTMGSDLLVDGGVLANLPVSPLRDDPAISTVIAIDVAPPEGPRSKSDYGLSLSGLEILKRKLKRERFRHPPIAHTVISSMLVGSSQARMNAIDNEDIDLYVSLDLSGVKLLDFDKLIPAMERGYTDALPQLRAFSERT